MAKKKPYSFDPVANQYKHNLSVYTIVTDANSFESKGERFLLSGDNVINIRTKEVHHADWQRINKYF